MNKEKIKNELHRHLTDSTAIASISGITRPLIDTQILGLEDEVSLRARLCGVGLTFAFLGSLTKIRDFSKSYFGLDQPGKERYAGLHDAGIAAAITLGVGPSVYYFNGVRDIPTLAYSTLLGVASTAAIAIPYGWYIDTFRDLTGYRESNRKMPDFAKKSSPKFKKGLAALATSGFIAGMGLIYSIPNHNLKLSVEHYFSRPKIEQSTKLEVLGDQIKE